MVEVNEMKWSAEAERCRLIAIRDAVFVVEQNVPVEIELDELDPVCTHLLAVADEGGDVGTGRMTADGHIGRLAVLKGLMLSTGRNSIGNSLL